MDLDGWWFELVGQESCPRYPQGVISPVLLYRWFHGGRFEIMKIWKYEERNVHQLFHQYSLLLSFPSRLGFITKHSILRNLCRLFALLVFVCLFVCLCVLISPGNWLSQLLQHSNDCNVLISRNSTWTCFSMQ